jgi:3-hydroxymyristoyl/3-hydroxydecanoyl-(acyl carrier protein) dehydratase
MRIAASHPALPGHFPGQPVVPGVVLLDAVVAALAQHLGRAVRVTGFPAVKFLAPLGPEQDCVVTFSPKRSGQAGFEVSADGATLASGSVSYEAA